MLRGGLPARSVRLRLTAVYGGLFLICGAGVLSITYVLVRQAIRSAPPVHFPADSPLSGLVAAAVGHQNAVDLHRLLVESAIALAVTAALAAVLGWLVAGRVLRPLRTITAKTRRISEESLHDRLALPGPRDELRQLADTIDQLLERLEAAFDAQRQFVANASHELRTPLAMMRTRLDVAIAKPNGVPAETAALDAGLRRDLDRAQRLVESFLALARAQRGAVTDRGAVPLDRVVIEALATRHQRIAEHQLKVHTALKPVTVAGSDTLLAQMVDNLVENAVSHNQPNGPIDIACDAYRGVARLVVASGGPTLDERIVADLAHPFQRAAAERTGSGNGYGLGLAIVAAVAAAHNGEFELHARTQGGLRVEVSLPCGVPTDAAPVPA